MKIGDEFEVVVSRRETNFDRACDSALSMAVSRCEIDDCGHSRRIEDWCRSTDSIEVTFKTLRMGIGMSGASFDYIFTCKTIRYEDE